MLDLASDLAALLDQAGNGVGTLHGGFSRLKDRAILMGSRSAAYPC
jgi:hypothetical protein